MYFSAGSRQYCRYTKSPWIFTLLTEIWEGSHGEEKILDPGGIWCIGSIAYYRHSNTFKIIFNILFTRVPGGSLYIYSRSINIRQELKVYDFIYKLLSELFIA